ncbi:FAD binding domain-containing protein [Paraphoma chrysanthemicola]|nr:FAD binding domain-containing protein [Paraphoma chrysanthemicola]
MDQKLIDHDSLPVIIIGAGISGLLLAQLLRKYQVPFRIFERDDDLTTRGLGWGLTLHWSLPALQDLLPDDLLKRLPDTYVDRASVERGHSSTFPFFDLSTGDLKWSSPKAPRDERVRVTRERLRGLLSTGIDVKWGKSFQSLYADDKGSTIVTFEDDTTCHGRLVVGCDGSHSRVRRALLPTTYENHRLFVSMLGFTMRVNSQQAEPILRLDPFFLQGTASESDAFVFISLLEAPQRHVDRLEAYTYQVCISWDTRKSPLSGKSASDTLKTHRDMVETVRTVANEWAEPFRSFVQLIPDTANVQRLEIDDFDPQETSQVHRRVLLVGDSSHAMTMYRGEGANHAIVDVLDIKDRILPHLACADTERLQNAIREFESNVQARTRPAVLASRQACQDAHDWESLTSKSPLLTRRQMFLPFNS